MAMNEYTSNNPSKIEDNSIELQQQHHHIIEGITFRIIISGKSN